jgi:hypothetical protein
MTCHKKMKQRHGIRGLIAAGQPAWPYYYM